MATTRTPTNPTAPMVPMRADEKQLTGAAIGLSPLLGTWFNGTLNSDHITRLTVTERDGTLLIRPYGAGHGEPVDWGERPATPFAASGSTAVAGFHACYEFGRARTELAANEKQGILVIQSYTSFHDGSGRLSHYAREFFHHARTEDPAAGDRPRGAAAMIGRWINTDPATSWIREFTLVDRDGTYLLRVHSANEPNDWGEVEVTTYQDGAAEPAFHGVYDLGPVEAVLAGNKSKGIIIIAAYLRSKTDGRHNFYTREFYAKAL